MSSPVVHDVHMAINLVHRLVYFVPEAAEEYGALGVNGAGGYFGSRSAPMGAVPDEVIIATFYNFSPRAIISSMPGVWETASPESLQAARFRVVGRALERVGVDMSPDQITEARALIDPVVDALDLAGKPLAAANAAVALPDDPLVALWQQLTVVREWRGDVHIAAARHQRDRAVRMPGAAGRHRTVPAAPRTSHATMERDRMGCRRREPEAARAG